MADFNVSRAAARKPPLLLPTNPPTDSPAIPPSFRQAPPSTGCPTPPPILRQIC
jgi:hypothetical protein